MRRAISIAATLLLLSGCHSNQVSDLEQQNHPTGNQGIHKTVDNVPQQEASVIPLDGRLRAEHMQMYVSVKIKQEQIRYEQAITYVKSQVQDASKTQIDTDITLERLAIDDFEFNPQLYFWAKKTIAETLARFANEGIGKGKRITNFEEAVIAHNLSMIDKFKDELRFAENYQLHLPTSITPQTAKADQVMPERQMALFLKPSS